MNERFAQYVAGAICASLFVAGAARADTVVLSGKPPFRNVQIRNFIDGRLEFRGVSREILRKPLEQITRVEITDLPMLSNAELLRSRDPATACTAYELARSEYNEGWLRDLISARLVGSYNDAGRFAEAIKAYLAMIERHPQLGASLLPRKAQPPGSEANQLAIRRLRSFWEESLPSQRPEPLRRLFVDLAVLEGVADIPQDLRPPASAGQSASATSESRTESDDELPPLLFGEERANDRKPATPKRAASTGPPPVLSDDSLALAAARKLADSEQFAHARDIMERLLPYLDTQTKLTTRILLARCRLESGQAAAAADDMLKLADSTTDRTLAARALYHVALAHERLERADVALDLYSKLLDRDDLPAELREQVRRQLSSLER